jgi:zinc D-Ala-D-Ala carboxypeptidase
MSRYFSIAETECKCGCGSNSMDPAFMARLDSLREAFGGPLIMTSGMRCPSYNQKVSTTGPQGPHTTGKAADFAVSHGDAHRLLMAAASLGFRGIGVQQKGSGRFIHVDDLHAPARPNVWSY